MWPLGIAVFEWRFGGEVFLVEFVRILVEVDRSGSFFRLFLGFSGCFFCCCSLLVLVLVISYV